MIVKELIPHSEALEILNTEIRYNTDAMRAWCQFRNEEWEIAFTDDRDEVPHGFTIQMFPHITELDDLKKQIEKAKKYIATSGKMCRSGAKIYEFPPKKLFFVIAWSDH